MGEYAHIAVSRRLWNAIADADAPGLCEILAEKTVWRMYGRSPFAGTYVGAEAVLAFLARIGRRADDLEADLVDVFASERGAVVRYGLRARRGARTLEMEHLLLMKIEDGRIAEAVFAPLDQDKYDRFWLDA